MRWVRLGLLASEDLYTFTLLKVEENKWTLKFSVKEVRIQQDINCD